MSEEWKPKDYGENLKYHLSTPIDSYDAELTSLTVLRVSRKVFDGHPTVDLRLWGRNKDGNLYPKRGRGLCMLTKNWETALDILRKHNLIPNAFSSVPITNG